MHGIGREIGGGVHPIVIHPLRERNDIVEQAFSASAHDIRSREPREEFGIFVNVARHHEFRSGRDVSIGFYFFGINVTGVCVSASGIR